MFPENCRDFHAFIFLLSSQFRKERKLSYSSYRQLLIRFSYFGITSEITLQFAEITLAILRMLGKALLWKDLLINFARF